MEVYTFIDKRTLARVFCERLQKAVSAAENFHLALSGGSTPRIIFETLAAAYLETFPWNKLHVYWGDERCVSPEHEESNYRMANETILSKAGIPKDQIHRMKGEGEPEEEAQRYGQLLEDNLPNKDQFPEFDMIILGLGDDGHTASIFPHQIALWNAHEPCVVAIHPVSGQRRISLTGQVINNAKEICFLVTGEGKAQMVQELLVPKENGKIYPASLVDPISGNLLWYLDATAASRLQNQDLRQ